MQPATQPSNQPLGEPFGGTNGDLRYRILHFHVPIAIVSAAIIFLWMNFSLFQPAGHQGPMQATSHQSPHQTNDQATAHPGQQSHNSTNPMEHSGNQTANSDRSQNRLSIARFTTATGYVALGLLGITLLIGPANLLFRRKTPISSYLARDAGTWAAIISVIHVIAGFFVHGPPAPLSDRILFYFFASDGRPLTNAFGWANWTGLTATVIVVGLLTVSSDAALRKLKARRWKNLQRLNYALFALVILHAIFYGALLRITSITTLLLGLIVSLVLITQIVGISLWRRRHSRTPSSSG